MSEFAIRKLKGRLRRLLRPPLHRIDITLPYKFIGSDYGGWPVPNGSLDENSIVYSFGVGEDISFDLGVIATYRSVLHAFDPTPRSLKWIASQNAPNQFHFHPIGIAGVDGEVKFYPPANDRHVSFSNAPGKDQTGDSVTASVLTLDAITKKLGHRHIDLLKMDIEGFEYAVIENILSTKARPPTILVEFHHGLYSAANEDTLRAVSLLRKSGYEIFFISDTGREYGFHRRT